MSASDQDLAGLPEDVAAAVIALDETTATVFTNSGLNWYATIRAELLRLLRENANLRNELDLAVDECQIHEDACDKAEAELAALKRKIEEAATGIAKRSLAPGCLVIEGFDDDPGDFHNKRVALLPVGGEG